MYLQAHQLVQQRVPSWVEAWPEMLVAPPVETTVVAPWTAQPVVDAAPVVAARPLETGWSKVRPDVLNKVLKECIKGRASTSIGAPAVTVAPPPHYDQTLAR